MDLFEKLFQRAAQSKLIKKKSIPGLVAVEDVVKYLDVFANSIVPGEGPFQCVASREFVGLQGSKIFLPEKVAYFGARGLNKKLYQNLVLQILGSHCLGLKGDAGPEQATVQRLEYLAHSHVINRFLDSLLPEYRAFQTELIHGVTSEANPRSDYQRQLLQFWSQCVLSRESQGLSVEALTRNVRARDRLPEFLFVSVPSLERPNTNSKAQGDTRSEFKKNEQKIQTEREKSYSGLNQEIDLNKEKANPVMHSFEKIEAADEYNGGRTMDSGDDDLQAHSQALDELNLTKVTRGGEAASSVFSAEAAIDFDWGPREREEELTKGYHYPEWNFKKSSYMIDHCYLIEGRSDLRQGDGSFRERILAKNRFAIKYWQSKLQCLFSEPLWQNRQTDGDELDIDQVVRDLGDLLCRKDVSARWYLNRKKHINDVDIVILFDQSLSSDSWISNRRVLDISLEAVGIAGLLFDRIFESVTVAGIWSSTRSHCSFQIYKSAHEPWDAFFKKADSIQAQGYTRLGPAIRHATSLLQKSSHKKKLILMLTDGKPTDVDGYEGKMGISDVAQACREAEAKGVLHYAIVLDQKRKAHFARMFKHFALLHDPKKLSEEVFNALFRLIKS